MRDHAHDGRQHLHLRRPRRGFTLVELVVVLAIAAIVISMVVGGVGSYISKTRIAHAISELAEMSKAIRQYEAKYGRLPDSPADVNPAWANRKDPWGYDYEFLNLRNLKGNGKARRDKILKPLNSDFDLYSNGPDGESQESLGHAKSRDDIIRARDGAFVGTAIEFDP